MKLKKSRDRFRLRFLISQDRTFSQLYLLNCFMKIIFLFNQMIIKIYAHIKLIEYIYIYYAMLHILKILSKHKKILF
jgi:hypothetical protein